MHDPNNNNMTPEDTRNLMIFCVVSLVLYLGYEYFILGPQKESLEKLKQQQLAQKAVIEQTIQSSEQTLPLERSDIIQQTQRVPIDNGSVFGSINTIWTSSSSCLRL